ncbi:hypothetical protein RE6C_01737 [Rhodopirellula europaea 6C]|uniref:Uncharacterized protein n=1 Tax=Rhodopirellula europaea 6C TaxID=1263867 RepID=M2B761_9BACT|nr:hypothetical protein RE6C_01737 [Rhodopirellula europaea 6C]
MRLVLLFDDPHRGERGAMSRNSPINRRMNSKGQVPPSINSTASSGTLPPLRGSGTMALQQLK